VKLGRVFGKVWATRKVPSLTGCRLLLVQPVDDEGRDQDAPIVAADPKSIAGSGDLVVVVTNTDATEAFPGAPPVNAAVVAKVEALG
jgi:ethanolamine utilization protein EutN